MPSDAARAIPIKPLGSVPSDRIPVVSGARVRLVPYAFEHLEPACRMWGNAQVVAHIGGEARAPAVVWSSLQRSIGSWAMLGYGYWAVVDATTGDYLGEAGFLDGHRGLSPDISGVPEAGWCLDQPHWGRGLGTDIVRLIHDWADQALRVPETVCIISEGNTASVRLARRVGYVDAGQAQLGASTVRLLRRQSQPPRTTKERPS